MAMFGQCLCPNMASGDIREIMSLLSPPLYVVGIPRYVSGTTISCHTVYGFGIYNFWFPTNRDRIKKSLGVRSNAQTAKVWSELCEGHAHLFIIPHYI